MFLFCNTYMYRYINLISVNEILMLDLKVNSMPESLLKKNING